MLTRQSVLSPEQAITVLKQAEPVDPKANAWIPETERWEKDPEHGRTIEFYNRHISEYPTARVLDVGAGAGKVAVGIGLLANIASVVAYDYSLEAMRPLVAGVLERVRKEPELAKLTFCATGHPWALPFDADSFDVIICRFAMHHFTNQPGAVADMRRCLRSGGLLLYSDPAMPRHSRDTTHGLYLLREENFHGYRTYHEMIDLVAGHGFRIMAARPYDYQRGTLVEDYLKAADPGTKDHLIRAWCGLDEQTKAELKWSGRRDGPFITYPIIDIAARKESPGPV